MYRRVDVVEMQNAESMPELYIGQSRSPVRSCSQLPSPDCELPLSACDISQCSNNLCGAAFAYRQCYERFLLAEHVPVNAAPLSSTPIAAMARSRDSMPMPRSARVQQLMLESEGSRVEMALIQAVPDTRICTASFHGGIRWDYSAHIQIKS